MSPMPQRASPIIVARNVGKSFSRGTQIALAGINLEIQAGEFHCIVGPSGCGKSTFLFMTAGLLPLSSGELKFEGRAIEGPSRDRGLVFQESALFPWLSVRDNIACRYRGMSGERAEGAADG